MSNHATETVPGARLIGNAMRGDYREHCDKQGFEFTSLVGCIPSNQIVIVCGRRKWMHLDEANRLLPNAKDQPASKRL